MNFRFLRQLPKTALAFTVILISTGLFAFWWKFLKPDPSSKRAPVGMTEAQEKEFASALSKEMGKMFLADGNLMNMDSGLVIIPHWLKGDQPKQVWFDEATRRIIGRFDQGFTRYYLDGRKEQELGKRYGVQVSDDFSLAVFCQDGNIHTAGIDWRTFTFVNQRQITTVGGFVDAFVAQNLMMATKKNLVIQNMGSQLVRVGLETGDVKPVQIPMTQASERRSPDGGLLVGEKQSATGQTVFAYDLDKDDAKTADIGQGHLTGSLWLGPKRCCILINDQILLGYDRLSGEFSELMRLSKPVNRLAGASPSGRFVFGIGTSSVTLADLEKKSEIPITFPPQNLYWIGDATLFLARDIQDSTYRGAWVQNLEGGEAVRVSTEPYAFDNNGIAAVLPMKKAAMVLFCTKAGIFKMKEDGSSARMIAVSQALFPMLQSLNSWMN